MPTISGRDGRIWRPQGLVPTGDGVKVIAWERAAGGASPLTRREWTLDPDLPSSALVELCSGVVAAEESTLAANDRWRSDVPAEVKDLLLCTHGSRDVCCGSSGPALFDEVVGRLGDRSDLRIWRTSHTGGHRFAPTALSLPDGFAWAHLDAITSLGILERTDPASLAPHCRGAVTLDSAVAQVADREALVRFGWSWAESPREAVVVAHERDTLATTIDVRSTGVEPQGGLRVRVELERNVSMPTCGAVDEPEFQTEPVWRATEVADLP